MGIMVMMYDVVKVSAVYLDGASISGGRGLAFIWFLCTGKTLNPKLLQNWVGSFFLSLWSTVIVAVSSMS